MKSLIKESRLTIIVKSAESIFFEKGFSKSTISDICKMANCSRTTLYSHFVSKENIYLAVVNKSFEKFLSYFERLVLEGNGKEKLLTLAQGYIDFSKKYPKNYQVILDFYGILNNINNKSLQSDSDILISKCNYFEKVKSNAEYPSEFLIKVISHGQKDGSIKSQSTPEILFINIWSHLIGSTKLFNFYDSQKDIVIMGVKIDDREQNTLSVINKILM